MHLSVMLVHVRDTREWISTDGAKHAAHLQEKDSTLPAQPWGRHKKVRINVLYISYIDGLVQERRNSSALAMELRLSCTKPSI